MDFSLRSLTDVLADADGRLRAGADASARVWPTGFHILDRHLSNGFRSGDLILLSGAQGIGKTTWALQVARNLASSGRSVAYFCFKHDQQTLLERLIALEAGEVAGADALDARRVRESFETVEGSRDTISERLAAKSGGLQALANVQKYADRMLLHRSTGSSTTLEVIRESVEHVTHKTGQRPFVVVDYLQKVKVEDRSRSEERITHVVEGLKDLALEIDVPVLAVTAADKAGASVGKRTRVNDLRGSSALGYEADTVLVLSDKYDVVARHHLVYDVGNAERFRQWAVLSIEKNRTGKDQVDLEFRKRFEQSRFEPHGQLVVERLVDERIFVE